MQYQDFEREDNLYQSYDKQKIHPKAHRTPPQPFTPQDLVKMFCAVVGILLPIVFILGMLSGNGQIWIATIITCITAIFLACIAAIVLVGFGITQIASTTFNLVRKKLQFPSTEHN